jgi:adenine-specific DNA-methyltransferase
MCKQSLINYLYTQAEEAGLSSAIKKQDIEDLIEVGEMITEHEATALIKQENIKNGTHKSTEYTALLSDSIRENAATIDRWLEEITVCDPAVGSGAFPVGMMNEIVRARNVLSVFLNDRTRNDYEFKRRCIEHSLYGVDIDPGAVEIAKLRLWLSLVVDEEDIKNIKPLPNLDYKIVRGDSLLGVEKDLFNHQLFNDLEKLKPLFFAEANPTKKQEYKKQIDDLISQITKGHKEFDFEVYFSEVFHRKGGFDVVIANPPYIGESGHKDLFRRTKKGALSKYYLGKMDYFYFFFHLALNVSRSNGQIAFITTNYYLTATGAFKLREDFKKRGTIRLLVNFNELRIFESAQGQHNVITLLTKGSNNLTVRTCATQRNGYATSNILRSILSWKDDETSYYEIPQSELYDGQENYIRINKENIGAVDSVTTINNILGKVAAQSILLSSIANINQGVVSGCDYVSSRNIAKLNNFNDIENNDGIFVFDLNNQRDIEVIRNFTAKEKKLLRPFFKNSDIDRYWCETREKKLLLYLGKNNIEISSFPNIQKHLNRFKCILDDRREVQNGRIKYHQLQWYRTEDIFTREKIVVPYRASYNAFAFNDQEWFCRSDCYIMTEKTDEFDLKYILALLNSSLYFQWFYHRGKRKGETLELFQKPLSEVPIKKISFVDQKPFIGMVDKILAITKDPDYLQNPAKQAQVKEYERQIDQMVYELYGLTEEEIRIVEGETK